MASVAPLFVWRLTRTVTAYSTTTSGTNNYNQKHYISIKSKHVHIYYVYLVRYFSAISHSGLKGDPHFLFLRAAARWWRRPPCRVAQRYCSATWRTTAEAAVCRRRCGTALPVRSRPRSLPARGRLSRPSRSASATHASWCGRRKWSRPPGPRWRTPWWRRTQLPSTRRCKRNLPLCAQLEQGVISFCCSKCMHDAILRNIVSIPINKKSPRYLHFL